MIPCQFRLEHFHLSRVDTECSGKSSPFVAAPVSLTPSMLIAHEHIPVRHNLEHRAKLVRGHVRWTSHLPCQHYVRVEEHDE